MEHKRGCTLRMKANIEVSMDQEMDKKG